VTVWQHIARVLVCDRRGHNIVQLPSPAPDPEPLLVLKCVRCGLREEHPLRKLNREERRRATRAA
jgi:hypothetical protein